jgi:hypothetical protein
MGGISLRIKMDDLRRTVPLCARLRKSATHLANGWNRSGETEIDRSDQEI